jgi:hypothetical protein
MDHWPILHIAEESSGPKVVPLHGLKAAGEMFRRLVESLRPHFGLIVPDLPATAEARACRTVHWHPGSPRGRQ